MTNKNINSDLMTDYKGLKIMREVKKREKIYFFKCLFCFLTFYQFTLYCNDIIQISNY